MRNNLYNPVMPDLSYRPRGMVYGGGGGGHDTVSTIPDELVPYFERSLGYAEDAYTSGDLSKVAGLSDAQTQGFGDILGATDSQRDTAEKSAAARDQLGVIAAGGSIVDPITSGTQAIEDAAVRKAQTAWAPQQASIASQGGVGGGRQAIATGERDAQLAAALSDIQYRDFTQRRGEAADAAKSVIGAGSTLQSQATAPGQTRADVGGALQEQSQREADASYQGIQRLGGLYSGTPTPTQQAVSGGK